MANRARRLSVVLGLAVAVMLLSGCGSATVYPGLYSYNAGTPGLPINGRYGVGKAGPAVLGGIDAAFLAEFGVTVDGFGFIQSPDLPLRALGFQHYLNTFVDGVIAVRDTPDPVREHQIMLVLLSSPPDQPWTQSTAATYSLAYSPADAVYVQTAPVQNAQGLAGTDKVYYSATLAKKFPASAFVDENGNPVPPGTFNIQCIYPSTSQSNQILSCQLALGTRQTFDI